MKLKKKFTKSEYQQKAQQILEQLNNEVKLFPDNSIEAKKARVERARKDIFYFFNTYLPHYFYKPAGEFHKELVELSDIENEPVFLACPRGHAKSTIVSFGKPLHKILYKLKYMIVIISDTEDLAADFCQFIQMELESNERIKNDFGNLVNTGLWTAADFTTKNGIRVKARGQGQRIRGIRNRQHRPDYVVVDDLENDKNVKNPRIVKETIDWLLTSVLGSFDETYTFTMVGTILSKKSVLAQMINMKMENDDTKPRFISKIYKAIQDDGTPLWWALDRLLKLKEKIGSVRFNQEMQNDPKDEDGMFHEEWIRYYHAEEIIGKRLRIYMFIDPSSESGASNDYKAIIIIGIDNDGIIYVLDAYIRRCSPDTMARVSYSRYEEFRPIQSAMEENALGEFAQSPFALVAKEKKYQLPIIGIKHFISKETRIGRVSPFVERGIVRFQKGNSDQDLLVEQLLSYPTSSVHDDGPDSLEGAIDMAEKGSGVMEFQSTGQRREHTKMARYMN